MTNSTKIKSILAAIITAAVIVFGFAPSALAGNASANGSAGITILESLSVSEVESVDFGHFHRPSSGQNMLTLSHADGTVEMNGSGDGSFVEGTSQSGVYSVQGAPEHAIQTSVSIVDFADPGISIQEAHVDGPTDEASAFLDDTGSYTAQIGGVIVIDADASVGSHTTEVHVTVEYE